MTPEDERLLSLAGLVGDDGQLLGMPSTGERWRLWPSWRDATLEGERIVSNPNASQWDPHAPWRTADRGMLDRFVSLADGDDEAVLAFAREYGFVGICRHLVRSEDPHEHDMLGIKDRSDCVQAEELWIWRGLASEADTILRLAAAERGVGLESLDIHRRLRDHPEWPFLVAGFFDQRMIEALSGQLANPFDRQQLRTVIASGVNIWLDHAGVAPRLWWWPDSPRPELIFGVDFAFAALAVQLALAVANVDGLATCSACQRPYVPKRKPAAGRRNYCSSCGDRARKRDSWRERR